MNPSIQFKTTTLPFFIAFALACFGLSSTGQAVTPAPDGGYPNSTTAEGEGALFSLTPGVGFNTAVGAHALFADDTGKSNTAVGAFALAANTSGERNVGVGQGALGSSNSIGNVAVGYYALKNNSTGDENTAIGLGALQSNTDGLSNTAIGDSALVFNTHGNHNTAIGYSALQNNTTGHNNIALGDYAGSSITTGVYNIDIGNDGFLGDSFSIHIGNVQTKTFIAGISGVAVTGAPVVVDGNSGQLGVAPSSQRFKDDIKPMDKASEAILALKPVSFRYKQKIDPKGIHQFGLVAEDVEKVNPDLVARDDTGKVYTVRYEAVNAMLLNEFLKEHKTVQEQGAMIALQQKQIEALTAGLQKVSAQLEVSKPAPQTVLNNQ